MGDNLKETKADPEIPGPEGFNSDINLSKILSMNNQIFWWLKDESGKRQDNKNAYQGAVVPQGKSCWVQLI